MGLKKKQYEAELKEARAIAARDHLSDAESKDLEQRAERIEALKYEMQTEALKEAAYVGLDGDYDGQVGDGADMYEALKAADFHLKRNPVVQVSAKSIARGMQPYEADGQKADLIATEGNANPDRVSGVSDKGRDQRYLYPFLATKPLSIDPPTTRVDFLQQTTRTLAAAASMKLAIDSSTTKPTTDSVATLATAQPSWFANISNPQPNILFGTPDLRGMLERDMAHAYRNALETDVVAALIAASGAASGSQGTNTVVDFIRVAQGTQNDAGYEPTIVAIGTALAVSLDVAKDANDRYYDVKSVVAGWGLKLVVSPMLTATQMLLVDPTCVDLYVSPVQVEANSSLYFESNRSVLRTEGIGVTAVKQGAGIYVGTLN